MNFLLVLIAAVIEFNVASAEGLRRRRWSRDWTDWLGQKLGRQTWWRGWLAALLLLGGPVLATALVFDLLFSWSAFLGYALALVVLVTMLGPGDLNRDVELYRLGLGRVPVPGEDVSPVFVGFGRDIEPGPTRADPAFADGRADLAGLAIAAERAWFEPFFWFFVLGPVGAVLYRLAVELERTPGVPDSAAAAIADVRAALEWLPSRLTVLALGLAGTLMPALETARRVGLARWDVSAELVGRAALAAVDPDRIDAVVSDSPQVYRLNQMHALIRRTASVWLVFLAIGALLID
jgi:AmpE protein